MVPRQKKEWDDHQERLEKTSLGIQGAVGPESKIWGEKRLISLNWNFLLKMAEDT